jgi:hypothetical membrane protein
MTPHPTRDLLSPSAAIPSAASTATAAVPTAAGIRAGTRALLACIAVAGPMWAVVALVQAATRDGFDLTRHPLSALSNGSLGWLQITNFVIAGLLTIAGAAGLRRALPSKWLPRLVAANGIGMVAAGIFVMDPADGFPTGTPAGMPTTMTWHSYAHMAAGTIAFIASIAACYVLARHFAHSGRRLAAVASVVAGTSLLAGNLWAMSGGVAGSLWLAIGSITATLWVSGVAVWLARR